MDSRRVKGRAVTYQNYQRSALPRDVVWQLGLGVEDHPYDVGAGLAYPDTVDRTAVNAERLVAELGPHALNVNYDSGRIGQGKILVLSQPIGIDKNSGAALGGLGSNRTQQRGLLQRSAACRLSIAFGRLWIDIDVRPAGLG
jgi:hypothetical protein